MHIFLTTLTITNVWSQKPFISWLTLPISNYRAKLDSDKALLFIPFFSRKISTRVILILIK